MFLADFIVLFGVGFSVLGVVISVSPFSVVFFMLLLSILVFFGLVLKVNLWVGVIFFLVYIGGVMVLFFYIFCLVSNSNTPISGMWGLLGSLSVSFTAGLCGWGWGNSYYLGVDSSVYLYGFFDLVLLGFVGGFLLLVLWVVGKVTYCGSVSLRDFN